MKTCARSLKTRSSLRVKAIRVQYPYCANVAAIDPNTKHLACIHSVSPTKLLAVEIPSTPKAIMPYFRLLKALGIDAVIYESAYGGVNITVYARLFALLERVKECAETCKLTWVQVPAKTWQKEILYRVGENGAALKRKELEERYRKHAISYLGYDPISVDLCAAACIYDFAQRRIVENAATSRSR